MQAREEFWADADVDERWMREAVGGGRRAARRGEVRVGAGVISAAGGRLVYGARDEKAGAVESVFRVCDASSLNHRMGLTPGVLERECRALVQEFFRSRRKTVRSAE